MMMTVTQRLQPQQQPCIMMSNMAQKCLLVYKMVMLDDARSALEKELRDFTQQASDYVQGFLASCPPSKVLSPDDLVLSLDTKRRALGKLLAFFKDLMQSHSHTDQRSEDGVGGARPMTSDVPRIENSLLASPLTKTEKVLSQQVKQSQIPPTEAPQSGGGGGGDVICSISSSQDTVVETVTSACELKGKGKEASSSHLNDSEEKYVFEKDPWVEPPTKVHSQKVSVPLPTVRPLNPKISNPNPRELLLDRAVHVQHQKETSTQLLRFLKTSVRNKGAMEVTIIEWRSNAEGHPSVLTRPNSPGLTRPNSPITKVQHLRQMAEPLALKRKMIGDVENQAPVFQMKRVDSTGAITYTYVNATKTELWDVGDIFTDTSSEASTCESDTTDDNQSEGSAVGLKPADEPQSEKSSVGVVNQASSIPAFSIKKLDEMEVVVSHIASPGKFHVQHADAAARLKTHISDEWKATSSFVEQNCIPDIGTLVLAWLPKQEEWCRARVTKICGMRGGRSNANSDVLDAIPDIEVEVKRLDYGDTCCVSLRNIRELTPELLLLPLQAVQVSLANVSPVDGGYWSEEAVDWFRAIVDNRTLYARLYPQGTRVMAELFLDRGKIGTTRRGASLSVRLTQNGHAKHDKMKHFSGVKKRGTFKMKESAWEEYLISFRAQKK